MGALADLDMALTSRPDDAPLKLRRGELLLAQGDWLRGLPDYEARLDLPGRYAPKLPRWQGEPLTGKLLLYAEQDDVESDAALRDTLLLARGVEAIVECSERIADALGMPTIRRGDALDGFAAAAPLRSLPLILNWTLQSVPAVPALPRPHADAIVGDDNWTTCLAARQGIETRLRLPPSADWLWGPGSGPSPWFANLTIERTS